MPSLNKNMNVSHTKFRPKQTLGQNFLLDENICRKITQAIAPGADDTIVEIGPGFGALTGDLLDSGARVIAVEIDRRLTAKLRQEFAGNDNFKLIENDFLKVDLQELQRGKQKLRIVGNIPYHITSPVMFKIFAVCHLVSDLTLMIQKEVAERIVAVPRTKAYGILSVFSQLYSEPKILFQVSRNVFKPRPDVESAVVKWDLTAARKFKITDEQLLRDIIKRSFNQRRKMLRKSLQQLPDFKEKIPALNFGLERRPEELTIDEFVDLSNQLASA